MLFYHNRKGGGEMIETWVPSCLTLTLWLCNFGKSTSQSVSLPYLDFVVTININEITCVNIFHKLYGTTKMETIIVKEEREENQPWRTDLPLNIASHIGTLTQKTEARPLWEWRAELNIRHAPQREGAHCGLLSTLHRVMSGVTGTELLFQRTV